MDDWLLLFRRFLLFIIFVDVKFVDILNNIIDY